MKRGTLNIIEDKDICKVRLDSDNGLGLRQNINITSKLQLGRRIYKFYLNAILEELTKGNAVFFYGNRLNMCVDVMKYQTTPYETVMEDIVSNGEMPYVVLNSSVYYNKKNTFKVYPSKKVREKLLDRKGQGGSFSKILRWGY